MAATLGALVCAGCERSPFVVETFPPGDGEFIVDITMVPARGAYGATFHVDGCGTLVVDRDAGTVSLRASSLPSFDTTGRGAAEFTEALLSETGISWIIREQHISRFTDSAWSTSPPVTPDTLGSPPPSPLPPTVEELDARYPRP